MRNFGKIKNTFNDILAEAISEKNINKKKIFKEYVKLLKEDDILRTQFNVFSDIETMIEENQFKASEKIKKHVDRLSKFNKKSISESNSKLIKLLKDKSLQNNYKNSDLHETISNLIFTEDINGFVDSLNEAIEYVKGNSPKNIIETSGIPNSLLSTIAVGKFNDKYGELEESYKVIIKTLVESDDKGKLGLYNSLVLECISLIDDKLKGEYRGEEVSIKEALLNAKTKLKVKEVVNEAFESEIIKLIDFKNNLL
jgi:hypothetical protein